MKRQEDTVDFADPTFVVEYDRHIKIMFAALSRAGVIVSDELDGGGE